MTQIRQIVLGLGAASLIASCSIPTNFTKNSYTVTPNPLEATGDMVEVKIDAKVPGKSMDAKAAVKFQPFLKTADGKEIPLKEVTIKGEKSKESGDITVNSKTGGDISYTDKIAYTPEMKRATLYSKFTYQGKDVPGLDKPLAEGTIATAYLLKNTDMVIWNSDDYKSMITNKAIGIYFPIKVSKFNPKYKGGRDISNAVQIGELKKAIKSDKNWVVRGINTDAYASPDGLLSLNDQLAKGRGESTFKYFKKELKKLGYAEVNDTNFVMGYTLAEDWKGLEAGVVASNYDDKDAILSMIRNPAISDEDKETQLRDNFKKSWGKIKTEILPRLRRSELVVKGANPMKTDEELMTYYSMLDKLDSKELFHLAVITNDPTKKAEVLKAYTAKEANDWKGFSDLGAAQIQTKQLDDAKSNLDKALQLSPDNPTVLANMGALAKAQNNWAEAEKQYKAASAKGADVTYNMAVLAVKKGNYSEAVAGFKKANANDFNAALATLLSGDAAGCKKMIDDMNPDMLQWDHYYLRAVAGARMNNQEVVTTNISRAIAINGDVRKMAKEDVEFIKMWGNPLFEAAIR